jgi:hypothetical protein
LTANALWDSEGASMSVVAAMVMTIANVTVFVFIVKLPRK